MNQKKYLNIKINKLENKLNLLICISSEANH